MPVPVSAITIAQALASQGSGLVVADTGANIAAALPNPGLTARVASFTLSQPAVLSAAQTLLLAGLGAKFSLGGQPLTLTDTLAAINASPNAGAVALATVRVAADSAADLLAAGQGAFAHVTQVALTGAATLSVAQLSQLESAPGFRLAPGAQITLSDSGTQIGALLAAHPGWFAGVAAITVQLDGAVLASAQAAQLSNLMAQGHALSFTPLAGHTTLNIAGPAALLATEATALARLAALTTPVITLSQTGDTITVAQALTLEALPGFTLPANALVLADSGDAISANLAAVFGRGFSQIEVTGGTLSTNAVQLLNPTLHVAAGASVDLTTSATVSAGQAAVLAGLPNFALGQGVSLTVAGTPANLLANPGAWSQIATGMVFTGNGAITAGGAITLAFLAEHFGANFSLGGHSLVVADSFSNIVALPPEALALLAGVALAGNATANAADFAAFRAIPGASLGGFTLAVADNAANLATLAGGSFALATSLTLNSAGTLTAAQANGLAGETGLSLAGHTLTVQDDAANLLSLSGAAQGLVQSVLLPGGPQSVTAAQAAGLQNLAHFSPAGATITVADTLANLAAGSFWRAVSKTYDVVDTAADLVQGAQAGGPQAALLQGATAVTLSAPATVTAATATTLGTISNFADDGTALVVADSLANLVANAAAVIELASGVTLTGDAVLSAAGFAKLAQLNAGLLSLVNVGDHAITIADTAANLVAANLAGLGSIGSGLIGGIELTASATLDAQDFLALRGLPNVSLNGFSLTVADNAAGLATLGGDLSLIGATQLTSGGVISVAQANAIAGDPNLSLNGQTLVVADTAANLLGLSPAAQALASGFEPVASQTVTVAQINGLAALGAKFALNGASLTVADGPLHLESLTGAALALAGGEVLNASAVVSAAGAGLLAALPALTLAKGITLIVQDSAANLIALGNAVPAATTMERLAPGAITLGAAQAAALAGLPVFSAAGTAITVADTLAGFAASTAWQRVASAYDVRDSAANLAAAVQSAGAPLALMQAAGAVTLAGPATVTAATLAALGTIGHFSTGGAALNVADSAANLVGGLAAVLALASTVSITGDAVISAEGAAALEQIAAALGDGFSLAGHRITLEDSAGNLTSLGSDPAFVTATELSGNATVDAAQAASLAADPGFSSNGYSLAVTDTAANLIGLSAAAQAAAGSYTLSQDATVSAAQLSALSALGTKFSAGGHNLIAADNAANLAALAGSGAVALASGEVLNASATIGAAAASLLAGLPALSLARGVTLAVQDNAANLLALGNAVPASATEILPAGAVTLSAAQASGLAALPRFSAAGATITVADTLADLAAGSQAWQSIAGAYDIVDSALTLGAAGPSSLLSGAASVMLSGSATVNAATAAALAALPHFSTGSFALNVVDSGANLLANAASVDEVASSVTLNGPATLDVAGAAALAQIQTAMQTAGGSAFSLAGNTITIADSAYALLGLTPAEIALAGAVGITGEARVNVAQYLQLVALPGFSTDGYDLVVKDSYANLVAARSNFAYAGATEASANATLDAAQAALLGELPRFFADYHQVVVLDTAAALIGLSPLVQTLVTGYQLSADATVTAAQLAALGAYGAAYSDAGHSLTVADTADHLAALTAPALAIATAGVLSASATVSAAEAAQLSLVPGLACAPGVTLVVQDSAAALLGLGAALPDCASLERLTPGASAITVAQADQLVALPDFSAAGATITVTGTLAALAASPAWRPIATAYDVIDSAANLAAAASGANPGGASLLAGAAGSSLAGPATVSAATLATLSGLAAFSTGGNALTVQDSVGGLLGLSQAQDQLATGFALNAPATVSAVIFGQLQALHGFSANGTGLTVADSAGALLALGGDLSQITTAALTGDAAVSASQFLTLSALPGFSVNGHALNILDTAANLVSLGGGDLSQVASVSLDEAAIVSVAQAAILAAEPGFSTNLFGFTIADTAATLLTLPAAILQDATALHLTAPAVVSGAQLAALAAFGGTFSENGFALTVADSAANLAALGAPSLALAAAEILDASATVTAATAASLAALGHFSVASGVTLTVQDSAANLLALGAGLPNGVSAELLPSGSVTLSAAQAAGLAALPLFSASGASITVAGTIADLTSPANAGAASIAAATIVQDSAANLVANAGTSLVQDATAVALAGNATVTAAQAVQLAGIPHFSAAGAQLLVEDGAQAIAASAPAIESVAGGVIVTDGGPVTAAGADALAAISHDGKLSFGAGAPLLLVQDSLANLTSAANQAGLALAGRVNVLDTGANLAAATTTQSLGTATPTYTLSQGGAVTAAQASALAAEGPLYSNGGFSLSVADGAAAVAGAASAIAALGITASVTDSAAAIDAAATPLAALGASLTAVNVTNQSALSAAVAAGLAGIAGKLATLVTIADTAAAITANQAALASLGGHAAIYVTDSAANLIANAASVGALASEVRISFDATVNGAGLASLAQIAAALGSGFSENGKSLTAADTAANLLALDPAEQALAAYTMVTGSATLAQAAALEQAGYGPSLQGTLAIADTSATLAADLAGGTILASLLGNTGNATLAVSVIGGTLALSDAQADAILARPASAGLMADLAPATIVTVAAAPLADLAALGAAGWPHSSIGVVDSAADIAADLGLGAASLLTRDAADIGSVTLSTGGTVDAATLAAMAALPGFSTGSAVLLLQDSSAAIARIGAAALAFADGVTVSDSAANLGAESSALGAVLASYGGPVQVVLTDSAPVSAAVAAALDPLAAWIAGAPIAVSDSAANIAALAAPLGLLGAALGTVTLTQGVPGGNTVSAAQAVALLSLHAHLSLLTQLTVSDSAAAIAAQQSGIAAMEADGLLGAVTVAGASIANAAAALAALNAVSAQVAVTDSAASVAADLVSGNSVLASLGSHLASVTVTGGPVVLSASQASIIHASPSVDSAIMAASPGTTILVNGVSVGALTTVLGYGWAGTALGVADTAARLAADLASGNSVLLSHAGALDSVTLTAGGTVNAATLAALMALPDFATGAVPLQLQDSAAAITALSQAALNEAQSITVQDSDADIGTDAASLGTLLQNYAGLFSIVLTDAVPVSAAAAASIAPFAGYFANGTSLAVSDTASAVAQNAPALQALGGALGTLTLTSLTLTAANAAALAPLATHLSAGVALTVTASAADADTYETQLQQLQAAGHLASVTVQNASLAALAAHLAAINALPATISVTDSAANLVADLGRPASLLLSEAAKIGSVTLSAGGTANAAALAALASLPDFSTGGFALSVADTASAIASLSPAALAAAQSATVQDSAANIGAAASALLGVLTPYAGAKTILLTDTAPVSAAIAGGLAPLAAMLAPGTEVGVSDSAANVAAVAGTLAALGSQLGVITLSATTIGAANAASLAPLAAHLAAGTPLTVSDNAATIAANLAAIEQLGAAGKLAAVVVPNDSVADVTSHIAALNAAAAQVSVSDSAAAVASSLMGLGFVQGLTRISLTDSTEPTLTMSLGALHYEQATLAKIASPYHIAIADTAAHLQADLAQGANSAILSNPHVDAVAISNGGTVSLTQAQLLASAIGETIGFSGNLAVTGVDLADLPGVVARGATAIAITDSAADIAASLALPGSSLAVEAAFGALSGITASTGTEVTLTVAEAEAVGVDDTAHAAIALLHGAGLAISNAQVSDLATLAALGTAPVAIAVTDLSANIVADLVSGHSALAGAATITGVTVAGGTLSLTGAQADTILASGALSEVVAGIAADSAIAVSDVSLTDAAGIFYNSGWHNLSLNVTETASQLAANDGALPIAANVSVTVADSAADIAAQTAGLAYLAANGIAFTLAIPSGTVSAAVAASLSPFAAHIAPGTLLSVADNAAAVLANAASLAALGAALGTIVLSSTTLDAATAVSLLPLAAHLGTGAALTVTGSAADIGADETALQTLAGEGVLASVQVTGQTAAQVLAQAAALNAVSASVGVIDSAQNVAGGLAALAQIAGLFSIDLTDGGTPALTTSIANLGAGGSVLPRIGSAYSLQVADTASAIEADLALGGQSVLAQYGAALRNVATSDGQPVILSQAQFLAAGVDDGVSAALAHFSGTLDITGVSLNGIGAVLGGYTPPTSIAVSDSAAAIAADLANGPGGSLLLQDAGRIAGILVADGGTLTLSETQLLAAGVDDGPHALLATMSGEAGLLVTGVAPANIAALLALPLAPTALDVTGTASAIEANAAGLAAHIGLIGAITQTDGAILTLAASDALLPGVADGGASLLAKLGNPVFEVTGATVSQLAALQNLAAGQPLSIDVTDSSANIVAAMADGSSALALEADVLGRLGTVTVAGNVLDLTAGDLADIAGNGTASIGILGHLAVGTTIRVADVAVADISSIHSYAWPDTVLEVADSAAAIAADLASGSSVLQADAAVIGSITLSQGAAVDAATFAALESLPNFSTGGFALNLLDQAAAILALSPAQVAAATSVTVQDSAAAIAADAAPLAATLGNFAGTGGASLVLAGSQTVSVGLAAQLVPVASYLGAGTALTVTGTAGDITANSAALATLLADHDIARVVVETASIAELAANLAALHALPTLLVVSDTLQNIAADLTGGVSVLAAAGTVETLTLTTGGTVNAAALAAMAATPGFSTGGNALLLQDGAAAVAAAGPAAIAIASAVDVQDTGAEVTQTIDGLNAALSGFAGPVSIDLGSGTVTVTAAQFAADKATLDDITDNGHAGNVVVSDSGAALAAAAGALAADPEILQVDLAAATQLSVAGFQALTGMAQFSTNGFALGIADSAATILGASLALLNAVPGVTVTDSAADIAANAAALATQLAAVTGTTAITLTDTQPLSVSTALGLAPITQYLSAGAVSVIDSGADLAANVAALQSLGAALGIITLAGTTIDAATAAALTPLLSHLAFGTELTVTGTAAQLSQDATELTTLQADGDLQTALVQNLTLQDLASYGSVIDGLPHLLQVADTAAAIAADLTGGASLLLPEGASIGSVTLTAGGTLDAAALVAMTGLAGFSTGGTSLTVADTAGAILALGHAALNATSAVTVQDIGSALTPTIAALSAKFAGYAGRVSIDVTSGTVYVAAIQYPSIKAAVDDITTAGAVTVIGSVAHLQAIASALATDSVVGATWLATSATVNAATLATLAGLPAFATHGHSLTLDDTAANVTALPATALGFATSVGISDSSANVTQNLAALAVLPVAAGDLAITLNDAQPSIALTAAQFSADTPAIAAITNTGAVSVTGTAAAIAAIAASLAGTNAVGSVTVTDTAADVSASMPALEVLAEAGKLHVTVTDGGNGQGVGGVTEPGSPPTTITANLVAPLLSVAGALTNGVAVADTAGAIASLAESSVAATSYLNRYSATLTVNGSLAVADASSLQKLTNFHLGGHTLSVWDTATHLIAARAGVLSNAMISAVYVKPAAGAAPISAANTLALLAVPHFAAGTPPGTSSAAVQGVSDSIANLKAMQEDATWAGHTAAHKAFSLVASDTVQNLIAPGNRAFLQGLAGTTLGASQIVGAAAAQLLAEIARSIHFSLKNLVLTVEDSAAQLLDHANAQGLALAGTVELAGATTLDAALAASLVAIRGFTDPHGYLAIADTAATLLSGGNLTAEQIAGSVTLLGNEAVSANTVLRLAELPHFTVGNHTLSLSASDSADAATLQAIGSLGTHFNASHFSLTATGEALDLTPSELAALSQDGLVQSGHVVAAISDAGNMLTISGLGVAGDTIKIYDSSGHLLGSHPITSGAFTVSASDAGENHNFAVTDVSNGHESAPVIVLDAPSLVTAVAGAGAHFATAGAIEVGTGQYLNLYLSTQALPAAPALVYNATTHVISLDIPDHSPVALVTLGGTTLPGSLTAAEIFVKHHG